MFNENPILRCSLIIFFICIYIYNKKGKKQRKSLLLSQSLYFSIVFFVLLYRYILLFCSYFTFTNTSIGRCTWYPSGKPESSLQAHLYIHMGLPTSSPSKCSGSEPKIIASVLSFFDVECVRWWVQPKTQWLKSISNVVVWVTILNCSIIYEYGDHHSWSITLNR